MMELVFLFFYVFWSAVTFLTSVFNFLLFQDDFAQNREFITLVVYKSDGKKVYYPGELVHSST